MVCCCGPAELAISCCSEISDDRFCCHEGLIEALKTEHSTYSTHSNLSQKVSWPSKGVRAVTWPRLAPVVHLPSSQPHLHHHPPMSPPALLPSLSLLERAASTLVPQSLPSSTPATPPPSTLPPSRLHSTAHDIYEHPTLLCPLKRSFQDMSKSPLSTSRSIHRQDRKSVV